MQCFVVVYITALPKSLISPYFQGLFLKGTSTDTAHFSAPLLPTLGLCAVKSRGTDQV